MILKIHYFLSFLNLAITTAVFFFGLYSDLTSEADFDPFVLLVYLGLVLFFLKNFYGFKFHLELKGNNYYSKTRSFIFYVIWSIVLVLTILLAIAMCTTLNDAYRILQSDDRFERVAYMVVWIFILTSLYTIIFDIPLAKKLKRQSDPSLGLLEEDEKRL